LRTLGRLHAIAEQHTIATATLAHCNRCLPRCTAHRHWPFVAGKTGIVVRSLVRWLPYLTNRSASSMVEWFIASRRGCVARTDLTSCGAYRTPGAVPAFVPLADIQHCCWFADGHRRDGTLPYYKRPSFTGHSPESWRRVTAYRTAFSHHTPPPPQKSRAWHFACSFPCLQPLRLTLTTIYLRKKTKTYLDKRLYDLRYEHLQHRVRSGRVALVLARRWHSWRVASRFKQALMNRFWRRADRWAFPGHTIFAATARAAPRRTPACYRTHISRLSAKKKKQH